MRPLPLRFTTQDETTNYTYFGHLNNSEDLHVPLVYFEGRSQRPLGYVFSSQGKNPKLDTRSENPIEFTYSCLTIFMKVSRIWPCIWLHRHHISKSDELMQS